MGYPDDERRRPILTLKQLPESRRAIVTALKERGTVTVAQLKPQLGLTGEAVRQQLLQLEREGWVESLVDRAGVPGRTGRPATIYRLTASGEQLFPKQYDALATALLDGMATELGSEAELRVLARLANERISLLAPMLEGRTLEEKVALLESWYMPDDPYMESARAADDFLLIERNCPYYSAAMAHPTLCSFSVNALTVLLGVRVARDEMFQRGHGRCVFHAHVDEPIDPATWRFTFEESAVTRPTPS